MMTSMLILSLAYALVAALLLTLCITLPGKRGLENLADRLGERFLRGHMDWAPKHAGLAYGRGYARRFSGPVDHDR